MPTGKKPTAPTVELSTLDEPACTMALRYEAISDQAKAAVQLIADRISLRAAKGKATAKQKRALGAITADLLKAASFDPPRPCFRPMGSGDFTQEPVGFGPFNAVLKPLNASGYVEVVRGVGDPLGRNGRVTRITPTAKLLTELADLGITPSTRDLHFADLSGKPLIVDPIRLRASSTRAVDWSKIKGRIMPVDMTDPVVQALAAEVTAINSFLAKQTFQGMAFDGLFRGFNQGDQPGFNWNKGGRLYAVGGGYQAIEKASRSISINGQPAVEVDIGASHLTILHALTGVPLPGTDDPYQIPDVDRYAVKMFVTAVLGYGKVSSRWSPEACREHAKRFRKGNLDPKLTESLRKDYSFKKIRDVVLSHIPLLNRIDSLGYDWADLQFIESIILLESIKTLMKLNVPALPLHDSLIVPESKKELAKLTLQDSFFESVGVKPIIKIK